MQSGACLSGTHPWVTVATVKDRPQATSLTCLPTMLSMSVGASCERTQPQRHQRTQPVSALATSPQHTQTCGANLGPRRVVPEPAVVVRAPREHLRLVRQRGRVGVAARHHDKAAALGQRHGPGHRRDPHGGTHAQLADRTVAKAVDRAGRWRSAATPK